MKLKEFNTDTCVVVKTPRVHPASLFLNTKTGLFRISKEAAELAGLKVGDHVLFHQDEDEPTDWYFEKASAKQKAFALRGVKSGLSLLFNNSVLARQIAESVAFKDTAGKCLIAGEPTEFKKRQLFGIITGSLINK